MASSSKQARFPKEDESSQPDDVRRRFILLGKTGAGKSSTGNTIMRKKVFASRLSPHAVTSECQKETTIYDGQALSVIDTPSLTDGSTSNPYWPKHIVKGKVTGIAAECISLSAPGPHAFLAVISLVKFNEKEMNMVELIHEMFGEEALPYTIVLFTHGDALDADGGSIEEFIGQKTQLHDFIRQCGGRYLIFNNRSDTPSQVLKLLEMFRQMLRENEGRYYTSKRFREDPDTLRMVLVGRTNAGKSSTGNTIFGRRVFTTKSNDRSITFGSFLEIRDVDGQVLTIVDTPGLPDNRVDVCKLNQSRMEIAIGVALARPHVLLVVIPSGNFTKEEQETVEIIQEMFAEEASCYTMALFTRGDRLGIHGGNKSIGELIAQSPALRAFINKCGGRYHVFNNRSGDPSQVRELLEKIKALVQKNGGSFMQSADVNVGRGGTVVGAAGCSKSSF